MQSVVMTNQSWSRSNKILLVLASRSCPFLELLKRRYTESCTFHFFFPICYWFSLYSNLHKLSIYFGFSYLQEKSLANTKSQIDQLKAGMAMKRAEMGTDLIDHLTRKEKDDLSRLNPEITELKEKLITCKTNRIEVWLNIFFCRRLLIIF